MATSFLQVANRATTTLASTITADATSLSVASGAGALFPSSGTFHITIDSEILACTSRSSDTLTVTRAQESTSAAEHLAAATITLNVTAKALSDIHTAVNALEDVFPISLTDGGVLLGSGTGAITAMSVLANGEMIVGDGTTDPVAESGTELRTSIGVGTTDSPQFAGGTLASASASEPILNITNTHAGATAGILRFNKDSASGDDNDVMGTIEFYGTDAAENAHQRLAYVDSYIVDSAHGSEAAGLRFYVAENDATLTQGLALIGQADADGEVDVTIAAGAASTTTVSGGLAVTGATVLNGAVTLGSDAADVITINGTVAGADAVVFEGATGNLHETTLNITNPTADATIKLPAMSAGTYFLPVLDALTTTAISATPEELNLLDGVSGLVQADLTKLAAIDATAAEIDVLDGLARGSVIYGNASAATAALSVGSANTVLKSDGTDIAWSSITVLGTQAANVAVGDGYGVVIGTATQETISIGDGDTDLVPELQVLGTAAADSSMLLAAFSTTATTAGSPILAFAKGGNATLGSHTIVTDGEELGNIIAFGDNGTDIESAAASIQFEVDGTPSLAGSDATDMPGRIIFNTSTDGTDTLTERLRIGATGLVTFAAGFAVGSDAAGDTLYSNGTNYVRLARATDGDVLTLASGVPSWATPTTGDITGVTAGVGLSGGGSSGGVTLTLDLSELSTVTPADGDFFSTLDSDGANEQKTTTTALATLFAGTGLGASSSVLSVDAAQTVITSLLATDIKIGEDDQTKIDFETADEIHLYAANVEQVYVADNIFGPQSDSDVDLGTTGVRWKDAFVDSITVTGEVDGASLDISGNADIDGTLETDNLTIGDAQGSDGQVLTSTGSGVAWEDAGGGGGKVLQVVTKFDSASVTTTSATYSDVFGADASITLASSDNHVLVFWTSGLMHQGNSGGSTDIGQYVDIRRTTTAYSQSAATLEEQNFRGATISDMNSMVAGTYYDNGSNFGGVTQTYNARYRRYGGNDTAIMYGFGMVLMEIDAS